MGLRCSLFGHAFEDPVTERDRETRGAEVLISVREVRRCSRCGTEQVIAENTEIRHLGSEERQTRTNSGDTGMADRLEEAESTAEPEPAEAQTAASETEVETDESVDEEVEEESDADISQYVDSAEPDESESPMDEEDVEILGETDAETTEADSSPSGTDTGSPDTEEAPTDTGPEPEPEPGPASDGETEPSKDQGVVMGDDLDDSPGEVDPEAEPSGPSESVSTEEGSSEDEPVTDDAIIIDNDAGAEDRESDIGRRELAGTGNMFDASAPERDGPDTGSESPDSELTDYYDSPSGQDDEPAEMIDAEEASDDADHDPWPGEETSGGARDDPGFQFGPDMETDTSEVGAGAGDPPSGFATDGPVDVEGEADDSPPKAVVCPACGFETRGIGTSLRAGDICPECHNGYLAERR